MYLRDVLGDAISDDAEFDDLDDFDYMERFINESEDYNSEIDYDEDFDDLDDLFIDEDDEDELDGTEENESLDEDILMDEKEIEVHLVCENCGHKWIDYITEEEDEMDFEINCPMCGSADISRD